MTDPLVQSNGLGVDSIAVLAGWYQQGIRPDATVFSDPGSEMPETYDYIPVLRDWLDRVGFPDLTTVRYVPQRPRNGPYTTIEGNCLVNQTLPSIAFGRKGGCSMKWKGEIIDRHVRRLYADHIAAGGQVRRAIGYDAGPCDSRRGGIESKGPWLWEYPLRVWGWDRERCILEIQRVGLPVPHKSACFFCPSTQPHELVQLAKRHPDLARRAVLIEDAARPRLTKISGLWGRGTKGTRGGVAKPGSWRDYLAVHAPEVLP